MAKVLIVDDDVDVVEAHELAFRQRGHDVAVAYSAREAEETLGAVTPDIAVIDVMMESQTAGFELARRLGELAPKMPALLVSGMHDARRTEAPHFRFAVNETWLPVVDFVDKPVDPIALVDRIERLLAN